MAPLAGPWRRPWPGCSPAVAALAVALALGASMQTMRLQGELDRQAEANRALSAENASKDRIVGLLGPSLVSRELAGTEAAPGVDAYIYYMGDSHSAYLLADNLPALPRGQVYQLWLIRSGQRTSGGTFSPEPQGEARLTIEAPEPFATYQAVGVTVEPEGGSPAPTGQRVLGGNL